ncbi:hypothetical protein IAU59_005137 [Kwoniella sp. CBS 9459]
MTEHPHCYRPLPSNPESPASPPVATDEETIPAPVRVEPKDPPHLIRPSSLRLPVELISHILSILLEADRSSLNACTRVCRSFYDLATPILYRTIILKCDIYCLDEEDAKEDIVLDAFAPKSSDPEQDEPVRCPKLASYTHSLRIEAHSPYCGCEDRTLRDFPNLERLILNMEDAGCYGATFHDDDEIDNPDLLQCESNCKLLDTVSPTSLTIRGSTVKCLHGLPRSIPLEIFEGVEGLTLICPEQRCSTWNKGEKTVGNLVTFADIWRVPRDPDDWRLTKVNWIFQTKGPQDRWKTETHYQHPRMHAKDTYSFTFHQEELLFLGNLITKSSHNATLNIVNAGSLHPAVVKLMQVSSKADRVPDNLGPDPPSYEAVENAFEELVKDRALKEVPAIIRKKRRRAANVEEAERAAREKVEQAFARVRWLTMTEYWTQNDWKGAFDHDEVKDWLKAV